MPNTKIFDRVVYDSLNSEDVKAKVMLVQMRELYKKLQKRASVRRKFNYRGTRHLRTVVQKLRCVFMLYYGGGSILVSMFETNVLFKVIWSD